MNPVKPGFVRVEGLLPGERGLVVNPRFVRVKYADEVKRDFRPSKITSRAERKAVERALIESLGFLPPLGPRKKSKRCKVEQRARHAVFMRDRYICQLCGWEADPLDEPDEHGHWHGRRYLTVDHIIPASLGGPNAQWNLRAVCCGCNSSRGQLIPTLADFVVLPPSQGTRERHLPQAA